MPKLTHKSSTQNDRLRGGKLYPPVTAGEAYAFSKEASRRAWLRSKSSFVEPITIIKTTNHGAQ